MPKSFLTDLIQNFFFPKINRFFFLRLTLVAAGTFLICRYVVTPAWTNGASMLPTYRERQFLPIWRLKYVNKTPQPGDVVMVRFVGQKLMLLKRVVATEGQRVAFYHGQLYIDGARCNEWWAHLTPCYWNLPERTVPNGEVYVIGDNRKMPMEQHIFGHVSVRRIIGSPLF